MKKRYFLIIGVMISASVMVMGYYANQYNLIELQTVNLENMFTLSSDVINNSKNTKSQLPIHISSDDFINGIHFTDLNAIDEVSKESIIIISGILEYGE